MRSDPDGPPDSPEWLAAPEGDRLDAVRRHQRIARCRTGNPELHAAVHVIVENQAE
jgi:hypothetical protein